MKAPRLFQGIIRCTTSVAGLLGLCVSSQAGPTYLNIDQSAAALIGEAVATDTAWVFTDAGVYQRGTYDFYTTAGYFIASDAVPAPGAPNTPLTPEQKNFGNAMMVFCVDLDWYVDGGFKQSLPNYWQAKDFPASNYNPPTHTGNPTWVPDGIYRAAELVQPIPAGSARQRQWQR